MEQFAIKPLIAEPVKREFVDGLNVNCWGYNGLTPGPTIEAFEGDRVEHLLRFLRIARERLLAQHVLAGLGRADRPRHVQVVRQRIVDRLDFRIGQQRLDREVLGSERTDRCRFDPVGHPRR